MIYLLTGNDHLGKDQKINQIKRKWLTSNEALNFDFENLHGAKLDPAQLKKALVALPSIAKKRVVLLRACDQLSPHNKTLILDFINLDEDKIELICDASAADLRSGFFKKLGAKSKTFHFQGLEKSNVFDITNAMKARNGKDALSRLGNIIDEGTHPLQIIGVLIWFWGSVKGRLARESFEAGLNRLKDADLNIKRSRINPHYAVEVLIIDLMRMM